MSEKLNCSGAVPIKIGNEYFSLGIDSKLKFGIGFKLSKSNYSVKLWKYDNNMRPLKEAKIADGDKIYGPFPPMLRKINDKLYLLYYQFFEDQQKIIFFSSELDQVSLTLGSPHQIMVIDQKNLGASWDLVNMIEHQKLLTAHSPNNTKFLFVWSSTVDNKITFSITDNNLKAIRSATEEIKNLKKYELHSACVDNTGNAYITYSYRPDNDDSYPHILINKQSGNTIDLEIKLPDARPYDVFAGASLSDNNIWVAGMYKNKTVNLAGVFSFRLNSLDFKLGPAKKTDFPRTLVEQFDNDYYWADLKEKRYGLATSYVINPYSPEDGSFDLVCEFQRVEWSEKHAYNLFGGILDIHFTPENKVVFSRIPKLRVIAQNFIGSSYYALPYKDRVVILYNDHKDNLGQQIDKKPKRSDNYSNSVLVAATMNANGIVKREILVDQSKEDYLAVIERAQVLSSTQLLIPFRRIKSLGAVTEDLKWVVLTIQ